MKKRVLRVKTIIKVYIIKIINIKSNCKITQNIKNVIIVVYHFLSNFRAIICFLLVDNLLKLLFNLIFLIKLNLLKIK